MAECEKCDGTGWMRIEAGGASARRAEAEKAQPGGFEAVGPLGNRVIESLRPGAIGPLGDRVIERMKRQGAVEDEPARSAPSNAEIDAGQGIRYAAARVAHLPERIDREIGMLILNRRGKARAISIREICGVLKDLEARRVKAAVETLRREARLPIAASKEPPYGYFMPTTAEECRECHDRLFREGVKLILHSQLFARDADLVRELQGQLRLEAAERVNSEW